MSIPEAFKGAALEIGRLPSVQRPKYVARTAGLLVTELLGTLSAVPFGLRSLRLRNGLKNQKFQDTRSTLPAVTLAADINYGSRPRNIMDIYSPSAAAARDKENISTNGKNSHGALNRNSRDKKAPVVLFVHGGVWASGSKWHYAQMATRLAQAGCVVCVIEYTLYPQANVDCMVREVSDALSWVFDHIEEHGGNENEVSLFGHSAGAHLCAMALLHRAVARRLQDESSKGSHTLSSMLRASTCMYEGTTAPDDGRLCTFDGRMPKRAVYAAGVFDVAKHYEFEEARGVHMLSTMERVMGGWAAMPARSPTTIVHHVVTLESVQSVRKETVLPTQTIPSAHVPLELNPDSISFEGEAQGAKIAAISTLERPLVSSECLKEDLQQQVSKGVGSIGEEDGWGSARICSTRKRKRSSEEGNRVNSVVPPSYLLDPPERKAFYSSFELAGDAIAQRVGTSEPRIPANASTKSTQKGSVCKGLDRGAGVGSAALKDAAERFAACLSCSILKLLPPTVLMSGSRDLTVPWHESVEFYRELKAAGVQSRSLLYDHVGHADFVTSWRLLKSQDKDSQGSLVLDEGPKFMNDLVQIVTGRARV